MLLALKTGIQQLKSWGSRLKELKTEVFAAGPWVFFIQLPHPLFCFLFCWEKRSERRVTLGSCFKNLKTRTLGQEVTSYYFSVLFLSLLFLDFDI